MMLSHDLSEIRLQKGVDSILSKAFTLTNIDGSFSLKGHLEG